MKVLQWNQNLQENPKKKCFLWIFFTKSAGNRTISSSEPLNKTMSVTKLSLASLFSPLSHVLEL